MAKTGKLAASVAIFYCELRRRSWAERTRQGDRNLVNLADLEHETSRIDEYILDIARTKIVQVLRQAGLSSHATPDTVGASTIGGEPYLSSLNDKHGAALDSVTDRRQQQAAREIAKTEAEQARIAAALRKQETGDARTARERHTGKWIEKLEAKRKGKGKGKGEGKGAKGAGKGSLKITACTHNGQRVKCAKSKNGQFFCSFFNVQNNCRNNTGVCSSGMHRCNIMVSDTKVCKGSHSAKDHTGTTIRAGQS